MIATEAFAKQDCGPSKKSTILAKATTKSKSVRVDCNLTLEKGEMVTKQLRLVGSNASGVRIRCNGGVIGSTHPNSIHYRGDIIQIKSAKRNKKWRRPEGVTIEGCKVNGGIRVFGLGLNGQDDQVKQSSRSKHHTRRAQKIAPTRITLSRLSIRGQGRIPVYFSPGVTKSVLSKSLIYGRSVSSGVYLDAESANNTVSDNVFRVATTREILSIDGSANNLIQGNVFHSSDLGGVYVYRNCGEGGAARHQKPMFNTISNNTFHYDGLLISRPTIWVSFKNLPRLIFNCPMDRSIPFGSGADDRNFADRNTVTYNKFIASSGKSFVRDDGRENLVQFNKRVRK